MPREIRLPKTLDKQITKHSICIVCGKPTQFHHLYCPKHWRKTQRIRKSGRGI